MQGRPGKVIAASIMTALHPSGFRITAREHVGYVLDISYVVVRAKLFKQLSVKMQYILYGGPEVDLPCTCVIWC